MTSLSKNTSVYRRLHNMGACASKRAKHHHLDEVEQKYDVLASLFATRAQDLANIVSEFEASTKAEFLAYEEAAEAREQTKELELALASVEEERQLEIEGWRRKVEIKDEEIIACHRVVEMRTKERNDAREKVAVLEQDLKNARG